MGKKGKQVKPRVDGVDITTYTYDQLLSFVIAAGELLDTTRKETQDFRSDAFKLNKFWQLTVNQLEECAQEIQRLDSLLIDQETDQKKSIHCEGQRVKRAQYDAGMAKKDLLVQYNAVMSSQREGFDDAEKEMEKDIEVMFEEMVWAKLTTRNQKHDQVDCKENQISEMVDVHFRESQDKCKIIEKFLNKRLETLKMDEKESIEAIIKTKHNTLKSVVKVHEKERTKLGAVYDMVLSQNFNKIKHLKEDIFKKMQTDSGISCQYKRLLDENTQMRKTIHRNKTMASVGFRATTTKGQLQIQLKEKHTTIARLEHDLHLKEIEKCHIRDEYDTMKERHSEQLAAFKKRCIAIRKQALQEELLSEEIKKALIHLMTERKLFIDLISSTTKGQLVPEYKKSEVDDVIENLLDVQKSTSKALQLQLLSNVEVYETLLCLYKRHLEMNDVEAVYGIVSNGKYTVAV